MRKLPQRVLDSLCVQRKTVRSLAQRERSVGSRVAAHQFEHGMGHGLKQRSRQSGRQRNSESIAVACRVFGGDQAFLAGDAQLQKTPRANEPIDVCEQVRRN